jgi:hypothetical protein
MLILVYRCQCRWCLGSVMTRAFYLFFHILNYLKMNTLLIIFFLILIACIIIDSLGDNDRNDNINQML